MVNYNTGINIFMDIAGGKWKGLILFFLSQQSVRTKEFYELIPELRKSSNRSIEAVRKRRTCSEKYLKKYHQK